MRKIIILLELFSIVAFAQEKGSFTDSRDKKTYKTVKIGKQVWMAENLNYNAKGSKCGGTNNPETREKNYFAETFTTCTYYSLEDKNTKNCDKYGRLYDWSIAIKACPVGWHLPSDAEWQTLVNFAGGDKVAGTKLKAKSGWDSYTPCIKHENDGKYESEDGYDPDEYDPGKCVKYGKEVLGNGNDTYGFSALPGSEGSGCWNPYGEDDDKHFFAAGSNGSWWSSTEDNKGSALSRGIYSTYGDKTSGDVRKISSYKKDLFSVRCVQDDANYADIKANEQELKIEVTQDIISVNGKKIAKTSTVAKQDSLLIGTLYDELQSKRKTIKNNKAQIHSDPNMYYDVFFKIITTVGFSGFTDISYTSKVNGKYHTQNINLPEKGTRSIQPSDNNLNLTVAISKDYLEIWARGGSLPKIFYKECNDGKKMNLCVLHKESEEDPGIIKMSVYSKSDSAYLSENVFITDINAVKPGATVATLSESSSRKLACGQSAAGVEDICSDGKSAVTLRPRSAYDELALALIMIHNRFIDSPDADKINIITDDDMAISKVLQVHHEAKTAGFFKANFPKLVGATNKTAQENGTFTDPRDKKAYKTVKIGELVWMAENLNYSAKGSKCYDNKPANCTKYGRLYNWDEAMKACPSGWHLPSNEDWDKLYYCSKDKSGGTLHHWCSGPYISKAAGKYLKAKSGWNRNGNGEDKFGFSALPGGEGYPYGSVGNDGNWWSSSNDFGTGAHFRTISYGEDASCSFEYNCKDMDSDESVGDGEGKLFSVRCVEDSEAYVRAKAEVEAKAKAEAEQVVEKAKQDSIAKQARQNSVRGKK